MRFERSLARYVSGADAAEVAKDLAALDAVAAAQKGRANDVEWARWLRATLAGDAAAAAAARAKGLERSLPPGEHPGFLLLGTR